MSEKPSYEALAKTLERERRARAAAEQLLEQKSTELYEANQVLLLHQEKLELLVDEKTLELNAKIYELEELRDILREDRDEARAESEAKTLLFAKLSHEIRTPLNGIIGTLNLLSEPMSDEDHERLLHLARSSSLNLTAILNEVIDFAKLEQGLTTLENSYFDLEAMLNDIVDFRKAAGLDEARSLALRVEGELSRLVKGDAGRIRQIIDNYLTNAFKHSLCGEVCLELRAVEENGRLRLNFMVANEGEPLTPNISANLFKPYRRLPGGSDRGVGSGAGLGLAICRELASLMDGRVWCEPVEGFGNRFCLELVVTQGDPVGPKTERLNRRLENAGSTRPQFGHHVLVVEDVATNQLVIGRYLEALGCRVDYASNGKDALAAAEKHIYNLVLMDIAMPVMDGLEATRRLRAMKEYRYVPIVGVSAHTGTEHIAEMRAAGMNDSLPKPIDRQCFERIIGRLLTGAEVASGAVNREQGKKPATIDVKPPKPTLENELIFPQELLDQFTTDAEAAVALLDNALDTGNAEQAKGALHQLKSLTGTFSHPSYAAVRRSHDHFEKLEAHELKDIASQLKSETWSLGNLSP